MVMEFDARRLAAGAGSYAIELGLPAFAAAALTVLVLPQTHGLERALTMAAALAVGASAAIGAVKARRAAQRARQANAGMAQAAEAIEAAGRMTLAVLEGLKGEVIPSLDKTHATAAAMSADRRLSVSVRGRAKAIQTSSEDALAVLQAFVRPSRQSAEPTESAYVAMASPAPQSAFEPEEIAANDPVEDDGAYDAEPIFSQAAPTEALPSLEGMRVLVGESNGVHQLLLRTLLAQLGAEAEIVGDGIEVMEAWRDGRWDLILLDLQMPRMDGFAAAQMIRSVESRFSWAPTPIVALTADSSKRVVADCAEAGMNAWVVRPIDGESLLAAIEDAFGAPATPLVELPFQMARVA